MARSTRSRPYAGQTRSRAAVLVAVFLVCVAAGLAWALSSASRYTAEARVAVGERTLSALQVPGYVVATEALASNYARYVEDDAATRTSIADDPASIIDVTATPIPESNVIRLVVTATDSATAITGAGRLSDFLIQSVQDSAPDLEAAQTAFEMAYDDFRTAQDTADAAAATAEELQSGDGAGTPELQAAQDSAVSLATQAATLDLRQQALGESYRDLFSQSASAPRLVSVLTPTAADGDTGTRLQRGVLLGGVVGVVACASLVLAHRRRTTGRAPTSEVSTPADGERAAL